MITIINCITLLLSLYTSVISKIEIHVKCIYKHIEIFKLRNINLQAFHSFTLSLHLTVQTTKYILELILLIYLSY